MAERKLFHVTIPLTEGEAFALLDAAAGRGETIEALLSGIATDIYRGGGDECELIRAYLERSEPFAADSSFSAFCVRHGFEPDFIAAIEETRARHAEELQAITAAIEADSYPTRDGWREGTTRADALETLKEEMDCLDEATKEMEDLWALYAEDVAQRGGILVTEAEALAEAETYRQAKAAIKDLWRG